MKDYIFIFAVGLTALALAATSAFFSITGLSKLFIGASVAVTIMMTALEFSKMVLASYLHQYWTNMKRAIKIYLISALVILMLITSVGVYGFLSSAYSKTSTDLQKSNGQIELLQKKKELKKQNIVRYDSDIKDKKNRIGDLSSVRKQQETRLDTLYMRRANKLANATVEIIAKADASIKTMYTEIDELNKKVESDSREIDSIEVKILELNNGETAGEVGPLKYISKITNLPMDSVVNYLMLMLIFVFDPLAVALVIIVNSIIAKRRKKPAEIKEIKMPVIEPTPIKKELHAPVVEFVTTMEPELDIKPELIDVHMELTQKVAADSESDTVEPVEEIKEQLAELKKTRYLRLLKTLYNNGGSISGSDIPSYPDYVNRLKNEEGSIDEKEVKDFLVTCRLLEIIDIKDKRRTFMKSFEDAVKTINILSD